MKYRSRTDIVAQIPEAADDGATKTKIMYKAFLSYAQLREYITILVQNGLLIYDIGKERFFTTDKGYQFLRIYNKIQEYVPTTTTSPSPADG